MDRPLCAETGLILNTLILLNRMIFRDHTGVSQSYAINKFQGRKHRFCQREVEAILNCWDSRKIKKHLWRALVSRKENSNDGGRGGKGVFS